MEHIMNSKGIISRHIHLAGLEQFERDYLLFQLQKQERRSHWLQLGRFTYPSHR